jgi:Na+-translocating ferredoxin:NAD+ oxidoreductase subunit D
MEKTNAIKWAPHMHSRETTPAIMYSVIAALLPALAGAVYFFGLYVLKVVGVCIISCLVTEFLSQIFFGKKIKINDGSAVVTGTLLAFTLPPGIPLWIAAVGGFLAIFVVKELFGGLGFNIFNPALASRAILQVSFPVQMTRFIEPLSGTLDAVTTATPLTIVKENMSTGLPSLPLMFTGKISGCIGETSVLLLLIGAIFLLSRKIITWHIPVTYILTVALLSLVFRQNVLFQIAAGGLMLGAFFMATDYVTSPLTVRGKLIFAAGCGLITFLIRMKGGYPEGVCYSIIFMNMFVPLIDKFTVPKKFGYAAKTQEAG